MKVTAIKAVTEFPVVEAKPEGRFFGGLFLIGDEIKQLFMFMSFLSPADQYKGGFVAETDQFIPEVEKTLL